MHQPHLDVRAIVADVALGDGKCICREVDGIDLSAWEGQCGQDGQATGTGAQIDGAGNRIGVFQPGLELFLKQFGNEGAGSTMTRSST